jgi:hemerythrin
MSDESIILVEWDDKYSVGIPLIDEQHKDLIQLTNELYLNCLEGDNAARSFFSKTIRGTLKYARSHFSMEERLMKSIRYPRLAEHKERHKDFILNMVVEVQSFHGGKKFVPNAFVRYLKDWILSHIAIEDTQYARYIIDLKKQGALENFIL